MPLKFAESPWTAQQEAILAHEGNLSVNALAGCGKSSTAVEAAARKPPGSKCVMLAYNRSAAADLQKKVPEGVTVQTLNGLGHTLIMARLDRPKFVPEGRSRPVIERVCQKELGRPKPFMSAANQVVHYARQLLMPRTHEGVVDILRRFDIDWVDAGEVVTAEQRQDAYQDMSKICLEVLNQLEADRTTFDFDDQVWLPHVHDMKRSKVFSHMIVDEAQDTNNGQIDLVWRFAQRDTEVTVIGDPHQAIYGFRGADSAAFHRLSRHFACDRLPLTMTFRCGDAIVRLAQNIVPDFEAAPSVPVGEVLDIDTGSVVDAAQPGDFVVSRSKAPLIGYCLQCLRVGKPANILGRDIARELRTFLLGAQKVLGKNPGKKEFMPWLEKWVEGEVRTRELEEREVESVYDKAACMRTVWEYASTLDQAVAQINAIFVDPEKNQPRKCVTLSTTHKVKGLEASRVIVIEDTYHPRSDRQEELNLYYVAITRARRTLMLATESGEKPQWAPFFRGR